LIVLGKTQVVTSALYRLRQEKPASVRTPVAAPVRLEGSGAATTLSVNEIWSNPFPDRKPLDVDPLITPPI
jgi:hypothetical protein